MKTDARREPNIPPTPETKAKKSKSSIERLIDKGALTPEQLSAALEIERVFVAVAGGPLQAQSYEPRSPSGRFGRGIPHALAHLYAAHYSTWAKKIGVAAYNVVVDVCVQGSILSQIDLARRWRKGTARRVLLDALARYAAEAGWVSSPATATISKSNAASAPASVFNAAWHA